MGNPMPVNLAQECRKAEKILQAFVDPANGGLDRVIPMSVLRNAQGLAVFTVARLGLLMSARAGSGVVIARLPDDSWSAPSALGLGGVGAGFNIGLDVTDFVIVLNSRQAVRTFMATGSLQLGGNLSVAVGPLGRAAEASGALNTSGNVAAMFSYSKSKGLYGGVSVEGTVLIDRSDANSESFGRPVTAKQILSGSTEVPSFADSLISLIEKVTLTGEIKSGMEGRSASSRGYGFYNDDDVVNDRKDSFDSLNHDFRKSSISQSPFDAASRRSPGYAFDSGHGRSTNSPTSQRRTFLGSNSTSQYSNVTDYGNGGDSWAGDQSANSFGRNRSTSQSTNKEMGSFARSGVQPRKNSNAARYTYGNEERLTTRAVASFPTKFASTSSSEEGHDAFDSNANPSSIAAEGRDPFAGIDDVRNFGGSFTSSNRGLSSYRDKYDDLDVQLDRDVDRKHKEYTANLIDFDDGHFRPTTYTSATQSGRRKASGMDSLDKELQQQRDSLSTDGGHDRAINGDRIPTANSGWRSDYGLPDDTFAAPPPREKRPPLHQRTSSAQRLWNRVRGNSQSSRSTFADNWESRYGGGERGNTPVSRSGNGTPKNAFSSSSGPTIGREPSPLNEFRARSGQARRTPSPNMFGISSAATQSPTALASSVNRTDSITPNAFFAEGSRGNTPLVVELQVIAMFDFDGSEEHDLSFKRGDVIDILRRTESREDWWLGRNGGRIGK
jgi:lipid-binding SYLF domain-containing protein